LFFFSLWAAAGLSRKKKSDSAIRGFFLCLRGVGVCGRG
jgi:hypothetical protein